MLVLGITNNDTAGACLVEDDRVLAAASEERFTRIKDHKVWPAQSIEFVLRQAGRTLSELDRVAYGWCAGFAVDRHLLLYVDRVAEEAADRPDSVGHLRKRIADEIANDKAKRAEFDEFAAAHNLTSRVVYLDHHEAHALGGFVCSPFDDALVLTCDGRGDFQSLTISYYSADQRRVLLRETSIDSLGYFYGRITKLLGFRPNRHEGKVTGLAAHGDPHRLLPLMREMIDVKDGRLRARCGAYYQPSYQTYSEALLERIAREEPADIAAAAQAHLEELLTGLVADHIARVPTTSLCLAGGVFGNVKLNQRLLETEGVDNVYVVPPMGDGGLPLHAAAGAVFLETGRRPRTPAMALGPAAAHTRPELDDALSAHPELRMVGADEIDIARLMQAALLGNQVLGVYRGRMEFGPRALGNRSIIYRADDPTLNDWLNKRLKRTEFMPFAPMTAAELADQCYVGWRHDHAAARFMTITYDCTDDFKKRCPAVVHVDNTARPQIVRRHDDPFLHDLLMTWHAGTGQPALVNTSFNKHEEPIVGSLRDALDPLADGVVDVLVVDDRFAVWRPGRNDFMDHYVAG
jgi:carbamoyltransferase